MHRHNYKSRPLPLVTYYIVDIKKVFEYQFAGQWKPYADYLSECIIKLEKSKCDFVSIAAVTPHIVYDSLCEKAKIPLLNIFANTAHEFEKKKIDSVLLLATSFTAKAGLFERNIKKSVKKVILPNKKDQEFLDSLIYRSLAVGEKKESYKNEISRLIGKYDCDGVVLGCTDLPLVFSQKDTSIPVIDTLRCHASATLRYSYRSE